MIARLFAWVAGLGGIQQSVAAGPSDPIYSRLVLSMFQGMKPQGIALAAPLGRLFRSAAPVFFASPSSLAAGPWMGVVFSAESSAVGVHVVELMASLTILSAGLVLVLIGRALPFGNRGRHYLPGGLGRTVGLLLLAYGAGSQLQLSWASGSGGGITLSLLATKIFGLESRSYEAISNAAALSVAINVLLISIAAGCVLGLIAAVQCVARLWTKQALPAILPTRTRMQIVLSGTAFGIILCSSPIGTRVAFQVPAPPSILSAATSTGQPTTQLPAATQETDNGRQEASPLVAAEPPPKVQLPAPASVVTVTPLANGTTWEYTVNGQRQVILGFGYNAMTADESTDERAARFKRDFCSMVAYGGNTILGWDEHEFDDVLMAQAAQQDLGVILPIQLDTNQTYEDARVRESLLKDIRQRVEHYRNSPALRMWGLGNEVLHDMARSRPTTLRTQAFASFLVQASDLIHELDPNHPVLYRDAEDVFLAPVAKALSLDSKPRPWFVYGMNFFTNRMEQRD